MLVAALVAVAGLGGVVADAAGAATFCVNPAQGQSCSGTSVSDLQTALTDASSAPNNTHSNTVIVGDPGSPPANGYSYSTANPATNPVAIVGAGTQVTKLTFTSSSSDTVLSLNGDGSSVSNLELLVPASGGTAGFLSGASASDVLVSSPGPQTASQLSGLELVPGTSVPAGSVTHSAISFPTSGSGMQIGVATTGGSQVEDDSITGQGLIGVAVGLGSATSGNVTIRRVSVASLQGNGASPSVGIYAIPGSGQTVTVNADNATLLERGSGSAPTIGAAAYAGAGSAVTVNLNQVSAYGNADTGANSPLSGGVAAMGSGGTATVNARNSILRNFYQGTVRDASGSNSAANVTYDYSDYDQVHALDQNSGGGSGTTTNGTGNVDNVDPGWPNPAAGDFTLPAGSPVINAGDPAPLDPATESTTDILGHPRISGGRRDMGAVEFQFPKTAPAPIPSAPRYKLAHKGTIDPKTGKVSLKARCERASGGRCHFKLTLTGEIKPAGTGKHHHLTVAVTLNGSVPTGKTRTLTGTLTGTLSQGASQAITHITKLRLADTGAVTDNLGTQAHVHGHITLKRAKPHKKHKKHKH